MASIEAICFRLTDLTEEAAQGRGYQPPDFRAAITGGTAIPGGTTTGLFLWTEFGRELRYTELPEDGGPDFARCFICGEWCWVPGSELGMRKPAYILCLDHDDDEFDEAEQRLALSEPSPGEPGPVAERGVPGSRRATQ